MKGLKKVTLATAISAASVGANAEMTLLDDDGLQDVTGQAGLTIDVESQFEIGEFAYRDEGFILIQGIRQGGNSIGNGTGLGGSFLDNLRLEIDVAGEGGLTSPNDGNTFNYGFSQVREIAQLFVNEGNLDPEFQQVVDGTDPGHDDLPIDEKRTYDDGDLVIHFDFTDGFANAGGFAAYQAAGNFATDTFDNVVELLDQSVDFRLEIDAIGLASSDYEVGSAGLAVDTRNGDVGAAGTTTLISQLGIQGYLGPEDLHIENNGNGFGADGSGIDFNNNGDFTDDDSGNADSRITFSRYFRITDLDVYIDIAGVQINDLEIHNTRGDLSGLDGTSSFGFAHSIQEIYAVNDAVLNLDLTSINPSTFDSNDLRSAYVSGIAVNTRFKGDIDINSISFGDTGQSIGQIFITDLESTTNWTISAHD